jgi:hypothetical protein
MCDPARLGEEACVALGPRVGQSQAVLGGDVTMSHRRESRLILQLLLRTFHEKPLYRSLVSTFCRNDLLTATNRLPASRTATPQFPGIFGPQLFSPPFFRISAPWQGTFRPAIRRSTSCGFAAAPAASAKNSWPTARPLPTEGQLRDCLQQSSPFCTSL